MATSSRPGAPEATPASPVAVAQELAKIKKKMAALEHDSSEDADFKKRMLLNELYSATGIAKAPLALEHIKDLLAKGTGLFAFMCVSVCLSDWDQLSSTCGVLETPQDLEKTLGSEREARDIPMGVIIVYWQAQCGWSSHNLSDGYIICRTG